MLGIGAAACAACCVGPILALLGGLSLAGFAATVESNLAATVSTRGQQSAEASQRELLGGAEGANHDEVVVEPHNESSEQRTVLGLDPEVPALVAGGVVASALLAAGLWRTRL